MSHKSKKHTIIGTGELCPKCGGATQTRMGTNYGKSFYFSQYDYCRPCKAVFFNEKYKILNGGVHVQRKFDLRIARKQSRPPERVKTVDEIAIAKRAYGEWASNRDSLMARFGMNNS